MTQQPGCIPRVRGWLRTKLHLPMKSTVRGPGVLDKAGIEAKCVCASKDTEAKRHLC